jgi:chromosome segregation ATPase
VKSQFSFRQSINTKAPGCLAVIFEMAYLISVEMTMESYTQILEEELENAVEVKDKKSLHRYILLLTQNMVRTDRFTEVHNALRGDIKEILLRIDKMQLQADERFEFIKAEFKEQKEFINQRFDDANKRFEDMNQRFEDTNQRFEDANKRFDDVNMRFDDVNKRFEDSNKRFDDFNNSFKRMFTFMTIGITIIVTLVTLYNFI